MFMLLLGHSSSTYKFTRNSFCEQGGKILILVMQSEISEMRNELGQMISLHRLAVASEN